MKHTFDERFTELLAEMVVSVKNFAEYGLETGLITEKERPEIERLLDEMTHPKNKPPQMRTKRQYGVRPYRGGNT